MGHLLRWLTTTVVVTACVALPLRAQPVPTAPDVDEIDVPLPHLSRVNGPGAVVQRDAEEADVQVGEHLAFGDRVTSGDAQVQIVWTDGSFVSLDRGSSLAVLAPDLLALTAGRALIVTPRQAEALRVDTPAGVVLLAVASEVRITVDGTTAEVAVMRGNADVRHLERTVTINPGHRLSMRDGLAPGTQVAFNTAAYDTFTEWAREPVMAVERSPSREYLSDPRLEAYADVFDRRGEWQQDVSYGQVWFPSVGPDWRPYSQGYWQPFGGAYGPTWVALDPWGWPTHHYGHWDIHQGGRWFWRPGRRWSPGRVNWSVGPGYVGWSPRGVRGDAWAWSRLASPPRATQRGIYPSGTLDPYRAWTVIPTERYGTRGGLSPYAVDARTLSNLDAFVTQRVAPPLRYGGGYGSTRVVPGRPASYPGRATGRGGYGTRTGDDTTGTLRRGVPPTRVDAEVPGPYVGPREAPPDDPYDRAREVMAPRGRTRTPPSTPPAESPRTGTPQRQPPPAAQKPDERPTERRRSQEPPPRTPPSADTSDRQSPAAAREEAPASRRAPATGTPRRAVPRQPA